MIGPVRCFTCHKVLGNKWLYYQRECAQLVNAPTAAETVAAADADNAPPQPASSAKTPHGEILDRLGLTSMCCRTHMLTHVDLHKII